MAVHLLTFGVSLTKLGLTQNTQLLSIWTQKSSIFRIFNPLKNQRYECLNGIPRPLSGGL